MSSEPTYECTSDFAVTPTIKSAFDQEGYIIVRGLLSTSELQKLKRSIENDQAREKYSFARDDGAGKKAKYLCWNYPGKDVTGALARCHKVAGTFEKLLGGEIYHYHTKLIMKDAFEGGKHNWHQDYGYWYHNGCLMPDMGTVFIALDKADTSNGCLKIIPRSHKMGRIDHVAVGDEVGADQERVDQILAKQPLIHVELEAGDAVFFHCNILHRSEQNTSSARRWAFLIAYNRASNDPVIDHHHPKYSKLEQVENNAILDCRDEASDDGKGFFLGESKENKTLAEQKSK